MWLFVTHVPTNLTRGTAKLRLAKAGKGSIEMAMHERRARRAARFSILGRLTPPLKVVLP